MKTKSKSIAQLKIENQDYSIRATIHAQERMEERNIDKHQAVSIILALGEKRITDLQKENEEAIIIDRERDAAIVIGFKGNKIQIITVIDKANVFIKEGTRVEQI